ncbi:MAG: hypothetical protein K9I68_00650 [Bacteroidales bacterium]|nr:hypothetical protein [Bacteroidales bacterium]
MRRTLANIALFLGLLGFGAYLLFIISGALCCCFGLTVTAFHNIIIGVMAVAVITFAYCMYNNCYCNRQQNNES